MKQLTGLILVAALILGGCGDDEPGTIRVPDDYPNIGQALSVAQYGDVILVAAGNYQSNDLSVPSGVTIKGATSDPLDTIIDGDGKGRVFIFNGARAQTRLANLTITGGVIAEMNESGGAVRMRDSSPRFTNCRFVDNHAHNPSSFGGAISAYQSPARFIDCVFEGNTASNTGGAVFISYASNAVFENCIFRYNEASHGGALATQSETEPTFRDCLFEGNEGYEGSALKLQASARARVAGCVFRENIVQARGGGLYASTIDSLYVINSIFVDNEENAEFVHYSAAGTGLSISGGYAEIRNCTIANNTGSCQLTTDKASIFNTIIFGDNAASAWAHSVASFGYPRFFKTCIYGMSSNNWPGEIADQLPHDLNMDLDPKFVDPDGGNFYLSPRSPCLPDWNLFGEQVGALGLAEEP